MVTSRLFDREFLSHNNITFDGTVPYGEDILFIIEAYSKAERICYLPQFIGYHYLINSISTVQSMENKPRKVLVSYAEGFQRVFDTAFRNGIYIDYLLASFLIMFAETLVNAKNLTLADRQAIKEYLEPYVHKIPVLPVSKLCTEQEAKMWYEIPREIILHPENFDKIYHTQSIWNSLRNPAAEQQHGLWATLLFCRPASSRGLSSKSVVFILQHLRAINPNTDSNRRTRHFCC